MRGRLVPSEVPLSRTRAEQFDKLVLDAVEHLEQRWAAELDGVEFAVEDVPPVVDGQGDARTGVDDGSVIEDGSVPLARLLPARPNGRGGTLPPRIVVYRRPLEARAIDATDLGDLVLDVVVEEVATLLGLDPDLVDPPEG